MKITTIAIVIAVILLIAIASQISPILKLRAGVKKNEATIAASNKRIAKQEAELEEQKKNSCY